MRLQAKLAILMVACLIVATMAACGETQNTEEETDPESGVASATDVVETGSPSEEERDSETLVSESENNDVTENDSATSEKGTSDADTEAEKLDDTDAGEDTEKIEKQSDVAETEFSVSDGVQTDEDGDIQLPFVPFD